MIDAKTVTAGAAGILLSVSVGGAAAAEALGEIASLEGSALISQGASYVPAREGMALRQLDRIVMMEDSSATLAFNDGCRYEIGELEVLTLTGASACQAADSGAAGLPRSDIVANAASPVSDQAKTLEQFATGQLGAGRGDDNRTGLLILGGLAAAGAIYAATDDDPDRDDRRDLSR